VSELRVTLPPETLDAIVELATERTLERLAANDRRADDVEYLTTAEYAARFKTTPGAVLARIHRGTLKAIRPPGGREWLVPVNGIAVDAD
jgi:hypothetical protein